MFWTTIATRQLPPLLTPKTKELADKAKAENDLAKAAKEMGATLKTSDLVVPPAQVPDLGQVAQVAPQLLDLPWAPSAGPSIRQRTGVVAKTRGQAGAHGGRDRQELRPDTRSDSRSSAVPRPSVSS